MDYQNDFEEMEVWQVAQGLAVAVHEDFPEVRDFSFWDQIKRAVVSISNNIAGGAERGSPVDFARFLDIAKGSSGEVRSMYRLAERLKYADKETVTRRCTRCRGISRQLAGFAKYLRGSPRYTGSNNF